MEHSAVETDQQTDEHSSAIEIDQQRDVHWISTWVPHSLICL